LAQEFGQHRRITYIVCRDLHCPNFQCCLINPIVNLAPDTSFGAVMLKDIPFAFSFGFDTGAVGKKVQRSLGPAIRLAHVQYSLATT
jgi:hypothetical protein